MNTQQIIDAIRDEQPADPRIFKGTFTEFFARDLPDPESQHRAAGHSVSFTGCGGWKCNTCHSSSALSTTPANDLRPSATDSVKPTLSLQCGGWNVHGYCYSRDCTCDCHAAGDRSYHP